MNLPQHIQDKLEEESYIQSLLDHPHIPNVIDYVHVGKQRILMMTRAPGRDLDWYSLEHGRLSPRLIVRIGAQLAELLTYLRERQDQHGQMPPVVHDDIKPSNLVFDDVSQTVQLVDWGSSVFVQCDSQGQYIGNSVMDLMSSDLQNTNAKLGDVYFIGQEQMNGAHSSPRFDEQGVAATLYALASGQAARFGYQVITPLSLGVPVEFARILDAIGDEQLDKYYKNYLQGMGETEKAFVAAVSHCWWVDCKMAP